MAWKDKEKQREAIRRHYYANRQMYIDKAIRRKKEIRKWINSIKELIKPSSIIYTMISLPR
jgi:hypothetical protein